MSENVYPIEKDFLLSHLLEHLGSLESKKTSYFVFTSFILNQTCVQF